MEPSNEATTSRENLTELLPEILYIDETLEAREIGITDAEWLYDFSSDTEISQYIPWARGISTKEAALQLIEHWVTNKQIMRYVIESGGVPCGYIGIWADTQPGVYQTGSGLLPEYRGNGIVNKVFTAIEKELMAHNAVQQFAAHVDEGNASSRDMLIKRGYVPTEEFNENNKRRYVKQINAIK